MTGSGYVNENLPFGNNPFVNIPSDVNRNPFRLVLLDLAFVVHLRRLLIKIILPLGPDVSRELDELYPSWANIKDIALHTFLLATQLVLICSLPVIAAMFWLVPGFVHIVFVVVFWGCTWVVMRLLNGWPTTECLVGLPDGLDPVNDEKELWFFINGVATGYAYLAIQTSSAAWTYRDQEELATVQPYSSFSNLPARDRGHSQYHVSLLFLVSDNSAHMANTPRHGFIFDLIECLVQRDLDYKTRDIRQGRAQIRAALAAPATKKLVLILHSQGGIEGSSILDWLLADLSHEVIGKLEIFTFGNAARRFNNPLVSKPASPLVDESKGGRGERVIKHIEHYANSKDFVANLGVLEFTSPKAQPFADGNAFFGKVFVREGSGHLLNMHYLDKMFTMVNGVVDESGNKFMNSMVQRRFVR